MIDQNNGWAVGGSGAILRYSSGSWGAVSSPTTRGLRSLYMLGSGDGWAVGDNGEILRYSNGLWIQIPSPTSSRLNSVFLLDSNHGWAVGAGGTMLHYDGTIWVPVAQSSSADLNSVVQVNPQEAWAVGNSGTILHWTGFSWNQVQPSPPLAGTPDLNSVFMLSSSFGIVVGAPLAAGGQGTILRIPQIAPIPEFGAMQILLSIALVATLIAVPRIRRRTLFKTS
jgi:photosystem II stability/assembly factor-like uncharacterized protein